MRSDGVQGFRGLIERSGGCAVMDGGLATRLEHHGADINDPLWSALCLITNPHLIKQVHLEYLQAGAEILVTSSYQATVVGFVSKGLSVEQGESLLQKSVKLACEARDSFWESFQLSVRRGLAPYDKHSQALVAASIGSYGAYLADGSEYRGDYGPHVTLDELKDFHRHRLQVLVGAGPDLLAFETIPNKLEAQPSTCFSDEQFGCLVKRWKEAGANIIGGCCRTTPATILAISKALKEN